MHREAHVEQLARLNAEIDAARIQAEHERSELSSMLAMKHSALEEAEQRAKRLDAANTTLKVSSREQLHKLELSHAAQTAALNERLAQAEARLIELSLEALDRKKS